MNSTAIMEELSRSYLETIAHRTGYFSQGGRDFGTDLTIRKASLCPIRKRYLTNGKSIDIQVKAVSEKYVRYYSDSSKDHIHYDLEVKNYNDLVTRANENGSLIPLLLAVFVLPETETDWISIKPEELTIKKCAFWYKLPENTTTFTSNTDSITIRIPKTNRISLQFYNEQFDLLD